jgi:hypothetical protein
MVTSNEDIKLSSGWKDKKIKVGSQGEEKRNYSFKGILAATERFKPGSLVAVPPKTQKRLGGDFDGDHNNIITKSQAPGLYQIISNPLSERIVGLGDIVTKPPKQFSTAFDENGFYQFGRGAEISATYTDYLAKFTYLNSVFFQLSAEERSKISRRILEIIVTKLRDASDLSCDMENDSDDQIISHDVNKMECDFEAKTVILGFDDREIEDIGDMRDVDDDIDADVDTGATGAMEYDPDDTGGHNIGNIDDDRNLLREFLEKSGIIIPNPEDKDQELEKYTASILALCINISTDLYKSGTSDIQILGLLYDIIKDEISNQSEASIVSKGILKSLENNRFNPEVRMSDQSLCGLVYNRLVEKFGCNIAAKFGSNKMAVSEDRDVDMAASGDYSKGRDKKRKRFSEDLGQKERGDKVDTAEESGVRYLPGIVCRASGGAKRLQVEVSGAFK